MHLILRVDDSKLSSTKSTSDLRRVLSEVFHVASCDLRDGKAPTLRYRNHVVGNMSQEDDPFYVIYYPDIGEISDHLFDSYEACERACVDGTYPVSVFGIPRGLYERSTDGNDDEEGKEKESEEEKG